MFCQKINEFKKEGKQVVYIDESGFAHDMPRTHGYSDKGKRCYGKHNWGAKGRSNVIGALIDGKVDAVGLINSSVNTEVFTAWVEKCLLPSISKQSVIVMDNATFHKGQDMQKSCRTPDILCFTCLIILLILTKLRKNGLRQNI